MIEWTDRQWNGSDIIQADSYKGKYVNNVQDGGKYFYYFVNRKEKYRITVIVDVDKKSEHIYVSMIDGSHETLCSKEPESIEVV